VVVHDQLPAELKFKTASTGGRQEGADVVWSLGTLAPKEEKTVQVTANCEKLADKVLNVATGTADPGVQVRDQLPINVHGLPAYRLEVSDVDDPVEKGSKTEYKIDVTNTGSLAGNQVQIIATLPVQMKFVKATGPSAFKTELLPTRKPEDGDTITFEPADGLQPGQTFNYTVEVEALKAGDVRFTARLKAMTLKDQVTEEESTTIYDPPATTPAGATPAPAPPAPAPSGVPAPAPMAPVPGDNPAPQGSPPAGNTLTPPSGVTRAPGQPSRSGAPIATTSNSIVPASAKVVTPPTGGAPPWSAAPPPAAAPASGTLPRLGTPDILREPAGTTPLPPPRP
jgi:uncharacterized repeat protein (TIGR01451 family)